MGRAPTTRVYIEVNLSGTFVTYVHTDTLPTSLDIFQCKTPAALTVLREWHQPCLWETWDQCQTSTMTLVQPTAIIEIRFAHLHISAPPCH